MGNSYDKYLQLKEEGAFDFDPTNATHVLEKSRAVGLRTQIMYDAMDIVRYQPNLSNEEAIIEAAKNWRVI